MPQKPASTSIATKLEASVLAARTRGLEQTETEHRDALRTLEEEAEALASEPLSLNTLALRAGRLFARIRRDHAHAEGDRTAVRLGRVAYFRSEEGGSFNKTEAEEAASVDPGYVLYVETVRSLEELRARAFMLWRYADSRPGLLVATRTPEGERVEEFAEGTQEAAATRAARRQG